jgi:hypothetical protein
MQEILGSLEKNQTADSVLTHKHLKFTREPWGACMHMCPAGSISFVLSIHSSLTQKTLTNLEEADLADIISSPWEGDPTENLSPHFENEDGNLEGVESVRLWY